MVSECFFTWLCHSQGANTHDRSEESMIDKVFTPTNAFPQRRTMEKGKSRIKDVHIDSEELINLVHIGKSE